MSLFPDRFQHLSQLCGRGHKGPWLLVPWKLGQFVG